MSRRCTLMIASVAICLLGATGCGGAAAGFPQASTPSATATVSLTQLRAAYESQVRQLDAALCQFAAVVGSSSSSTDALKRAASDTAAVSRLVTNRLAARPWPGRLQADSQVLIMAIAAVEAKLRLATLPTSRPAVMKHIQKAQQLIARIPLAGAQIRKDLQVASGSGCGPA
jgi:hypothetical protein